MTRAGPTAGGIGGRSIGANRGHLRAWRALRDCRRRLHFTLYDFLLVRYGLLVDAAVPGASTPSRGRGRGSVFTNRRCSLCLQRSGLNRRECRDRSRENPMS
jgi:hypothetical protein